MHVMKAINILREFSENRFHLAQATMLNRYQGCYLLFQITFSLLYTFFIASPKPPYNTRPEGLGIGGKRWQKEAKGGHNTRPEGSGSLLGIGGKRRQKAAKGGKRRQKAVKGGKRQQNSLHFTRYPHVHQAFRNPKGLCQTEGTIKACLPIHAMLNFLKIYRNEQNFTGLVLQSWGFQEV